MRGYKIENTTEEQKLSRQWSTFDEFLINQKATYKSIKILLTIVVLPLSMNVIGILFTFIIWFIIWFPTIWVKWFHSDIEAVEYAKNEEYKPGPRVCRLYNGGLSVIFYNGFFISTYRRLRKSGSYEQVYRLADNNYVLFRDGKYGLFNTKTKKTVSEAINDNIDLIGNYIVITKGNDSQYYTMEGHQRFFES